MMDIITTLEQLASKMSNLLSIDSWNKVEKCDLEKSDGRKKNAPEYATRGSFLYVAYDDKDRVLYVGESSVSIRRRFIGDGSGAHKNKNWYNSVSYIQYYKATPENLPEPHRKMAEQAISIIHKPKHYGRMPSSEKMLQSESSS